MKIIFGWASEMALDGAVVFVLSFAGKVTFWRLAE